VRQLARAIGASLGVALSSAVVARESQAAWNGLGGHLSAFSPAVSQYLEPLGLHGGEPAAGAVLGRLLGQQAQFQGVLDGFYLLGWSVIICLPLLLFIGKGVGRHRPGPEPASNAGSVRGGAGANRSGEAGLPAGKESTA